MIRLVFTTFSSPSDAEDVVRTLVTEQLAACGTVVPGARSIFAWEGKIQENNEVMVWIKTAPERLAALELRLRELHPYDVPEIVVLDPTGVASEYAAWVRKSTGLDPVE